MCTKVGGKIRMAKHLRGGRKDRALKRQLAWSSVLFFVLSFFVLLGVGRPSSGRAEVDLWEGTLLTPRFAPAV